MSLTEKAGRKREPHVSKNFTYLIIVIEETRSRVMAFDDFLSGGSAVVRRCSGAVMVW